MAKITVLYGNEFQVVVAKVAEHLDTYTDTRLRMGWTVEHPHARGATLRTPGYMHPTAGTLEVSIHARLDGDRIEWSGVFPRGAHGAYYGPAYGESHPKITTAATRNPESVAKEIRRRLLPAFVPMLARSNARKAEAEAYASGSKAFAEELAAILDVPVRDSNGDLSLSFYREGVSADIRVYDGSIRVDRLSLDRLGARQFACLLREVGARANLEKLAADAIMATINGAAEEEA